FPLQGPFEVQGEPALNIVLGSGADSVPDTEVAIPAGEQIIRIRDKGDSLGESFEVGRFELRLVDGQAVLRQSTGALTLANKPARLEVGLKVLKEARRFVAVDQRQRVSAELVDGLIPGVCPIGLRMDARGY